MMIFNISYVLFDSLAGERTISIQDARLSLLCELELCNDKIQSEKYSKNPMQSIKRFFLLIRGH